MDQQDQIYMISGIFAGVALILFIFIGYLMFRVAKITEQLQGDKVNKRDTYAYNNPTILPGEELNRRGYVMPDSSASTMSRDPAQFARLPRAEDRIGSKDVSKDFSSILNNNDLVFGGEIKRPKLRNQSNLEPSHRLSNYNNNFSFQSTERPPLQQQPENSINYNNFPLQPIDRSSEGNINYMAQQRAPY